MSQYPATISLSDIDGTNGFGIDRQRQGRYVQVGYYTSAVSAGDINGDGFKDLLVREYRAGDAYGYYSFGKAYLIYGKADGYPKNLSPKDVSSSGGFSMSFDDFDPTSVATAGDVNGDGFADFIVGVSGASGFFHDNSQPGAAYVVFGKAGSFGSSLDPGSLDGQNGFKITGVGRNDLAGESVASAGDVNGDGFADIIVGAPNGLNAEGTRSGAAYVIFGKADGFSASIDLAGLDGTNGFKIDGDNSTRHIGSIVSAGDVNGDGFSDLIVNGTYVVFGKATGLGAEVSVSTLDGTNGFTIARGATVSSAGDINGDGIADIVVGNASDGPKGKYVGRAYVVFGTTDGFGATVDPTTLDGTNGFRIDGTSTGDKAGYSVAAAGDVNGDGFGDVIISATGANGGAGAAYVVFGKAGGFASSIDVSDLDGTNGFEITSIDSGKQHFDIETVSSVGDINGDGFDDLSVSSYSAGSYVILGRAPDAAVNRTGTDIGQTISGGAFADRLIGLGGDDTLRGNDGNDYLEGDAGNDMLRGGAGADTMVGGKGDDTYFVDNTGDKIVEARGNGIDSVRSTVSFSLAGAFADNLVLNGVAAKIGTGNGDANTIIGSIAKNTLTGGRGDDFLSGGKGADTFVYHAGWGLDEIADFTGGNGHDHDVIKIDKGLFKNYAELMAHTIDSGAGSIITYDSANKITLDDVHKAALTAADFKFV